MTETPELVRAVRFDRAIACGRCEAIALAEANSEGILSFPLDAHAAWNGWRRKGQDSVGAPGGTWHVAPDGARKQPPLRGRIETLPAILQCPACGTRNMLDPIYLDVPAGQVRAVAALDLGRGF